MQTAETKVCPRCRETKPREAYRTRCGGLYLESYCRECDRTRLRTVHRKAADEERARASLAAPHRCSSRYCCGEDAPPPLALSPGMALWGLAARNAELARMGLSRIGMLRVNGRAEVWLSRQGPPRIFRTKGGARTWARRVNVRLFPEPEEGALLDMGSSLGAEAWDASTGTRRHAPSALSGPKPEGACTLRNTAYTLGRR